MAQFETANRSAIGKRIAEAFDPVAEKRNYDYRKLRGAIWSLLVVLTALIGVSLLFAIVTNLILSGFSSISIDLLTKEGLSGGLAHAIIGTVLMLGFAALIAVPIAIGIAILLSEYRNNWFSEAVRFCVDLLAQMPSIVIGLFVWMFIVNYGILKPSGFAGSIALTFVIVPIVARTVEEILRLVPQGLREAALGLGAPRWKVILTVVIPAVLPGLLTGVVLGLARAAGETAPILLVTGNDFIKFDIFNEPVGAIPLQIYKDTVAGNFPRAYSAALVLVIVIAIFSAIVRTVTNRFRIPQS